MNAFSAMGGDSGPSSQGTSDLSQMIQNTPKEKLAEVAKTYEESGKVTLGTFKRFFDVLIVSMFVFLVVAFLSKRSKCGKKRESAFRHVIRFSAWGTLVGVTAGAIAALGYRWMKEYEAETPDVTGNSSSSTSTSSRQGQQQ
jgi:Na+-driven multidrug efflux pump